MEANETHEFDIRKLLYELRKYAWLIIAITLTVSVAVIFWTLGQPKIYEATCTIEYDTSPAKPLGNQVEDVAEPVSNFWLTQEYYETQNRIIGSRQVAKRVVETLQLHKDNDFLGIDPKKLKKPISVDETADILTQKLNITPEKGTRIVYITIRDRKAKRATAIVNAIAEAYIKKTVQDRLGTTVDALEWLSKQSEKMQAELQTAEEDLHQFKKDSNTLSVSLEDGQNIVAREIGRYTENLTAARTRRIELAAKLKQLNLANGDNPFEIHAPSINEDVEIQELRKKHEEKSAEKATLSTRYGEAHPTVKAVSAELEALRTQLRRRVNGLIATAKANLREAQSIEQGLKAELDRAHDAGMALNLKEIEYQRLNRERENKKRLYELLLERTTETNLTRLFKVASVRVVDNALVSQSPVSPRVPLNIAAGILAGLLLGVGIAFGLTRLDRSIKSTDDIEALGISALGVIPAMDAKRKRAFKRHKPWNAPRDPSHDLVVHHDPQSTVAEAFRAVRTNLTFLAAKEEMRSLLITSTSPGDGKTTTATSLAITMAQSGKKVLLVDTDMRRPRLQQVFNLDSAQGITSVLVGNQQENDVISESFIENLSILPCGPIPPNPSELLHMPRFEALLLRLQQHYDRVIFDSPPLSAVTDAAVIAPRVSAVIVVAQSRRTTRDGLKRIIKRLNDIGARMAGTIINYVHLSEHGYGYGYQSGSYYSYYGQEEPKKRSSNDESTQHAA